MIKKLPFIFILSVCMSGLLMAQHHDLRITFEAGKVVPELIGSSRIYMYSDAVITGTSGTRERDSVNGNQEGEIGIMNQQGDDQWTICINPDDYFRNRNSGMESDDLRIRAINLYFRNENGTVYGYKDNGSHIVIDMTVNPPLSGSPGVTISACKSGSSDWTTKDFVVNNFPNPVKTHTEFTYNLKSQASKVSIKIYDLIGQHVRTINQYDQKAGIHKITWNGENDKGNPLRNGLYFYALEADGITLKTNRMVLSK